MSSLKSTMNSSISDSLYFSSLPFFLSFFYYTILSCWCVMVWIVKRLNTILIPISFDSELWVWVSLKLPLQFENLYFCYCYIEPWPLLFLYNIYLLWVLTFARETYNNNVIISAKIYYILLPQKSICVLSTFYFAFLLFCANG